MRILLKEELYNYAKSELITVHKLYDKWLKNNELINETDQFEILNNINKLNSDHHNTVTFEKNFIQLFSKMEKDFWSEKEILKPQSLDRANMGGYFSGLQLSSGIYLFIESIEMGVVIYAIEKELNKSNIKEFKSAIDWLVKSLSNPDQALRELEVIKLEKELSDNKTLSTRMKI